MVLFVHVRDGAATRHRGYPVLEEVLLRHEDARCAWPTDELVRRDKDRVLVGEVPVGAPEVHVDLHVGPRPRSPRKRARRAWEEDGGLGRLRPDPGDVRRGGEAADLEGAVCVRDELTLKLLKIDAPVRVLVDRHDVRDRLTPRELVGVVLVGADEDDRAPLLRDGVTQIELAVELVGQRDVERVDQLVDGAGRTRTTEEHDVAVAGADGLADQRASSRKRVVCSPVCEVSVCVFA